MPDDVNAIAALLSEFNTKIADLEARYDMLRERILITSESFLKSRDSMNKEINLLKSELREIKTEIEKGRETTQYIVSELSQFARKEELKIIERYIKLWEPLKFVKAEEVKEIINEELKKSRKKTEKEES